MAGVIQWTVAGLHQLLTVSQELDELVSSPPAGIKVRLPDEANVNNWEVTLTGPAQSTYAVSGGSSIPHSVVISVTYPRDSLVLSWALLSFTAACQPRPCIALRFRL